MGFRSIPCPDNSARASAVVRSGELRPYGNILLTKGVVNRYEPAP